MRSAKFSITSIACPILSIVSFGLYAAIFEVANATAFYALWIITGIGACILPMFAKYLRKKNGRSGKVFEIIGLAIASLNISIVAMIVLYPLTDLSDLIGWAVAISICVCYAKTSNNIVPEEHDTNQLDEKTSAEPPVEGIPTEQPIEESSAEDPIEEPSADPAPDTKHTDTPPAPASNQTDYKVPFIATAITAAVLAICAIIAVISASNMYSESDMKQSYSKAYNSGYEAGLQSGQEDGFQSGYNTGYNDGYSSGSDDGYIEGYCRGYTLSARDLADEEISQRLFIKLLDYLAEYSYTGYSEYYNWLQNFRKLLK